MGRSYSLDLRERVVAAVDDGMSCAEAARHYGVNHSSVTEAGYAQPQATTF